MKKLIVIVSVVFLAHAAQSQIFSWGIKGGVNSSKIKFDDFSVDGVPSVTVDPADALEPDFFIPIDATTSVINPKYINVTMPNVAFTPSSYELGYHFGAFARIKVLALFIQPELIFSQTNANIDVTKEDALGDFQNSISKVTYTNFDIPVMVGIKLGPARLCAGPVATFKLSTEADAATQEIIDMTNDFTAVTKTATFGAQVGVGVDILKKVTVDLRYEFGLSQLGDDIKVGDTTFKTDQRQNQFIASLGWMF
jgi:hypothetical protein